uniref:Uncharacterized protein n=1 Tax=Lepeophtheirus salmonis TaxID=72036 RepID=A0A0K2T5U8_LEPSM
MNIFCLSQIDITSTVFEFLNLYTIIHFRAFMVHSEYNYEYIYII